MSDSSKNFKCLQISLKFHFSVGVNRSRSTIICIMNLYPSFTGINSGSLIMFIFVEYSANFFYSAVIEESEYRHRQYFAVSLNISDAAPVSI